MVINFVLGRDGDYWEATCSRFETLAFGRSRNDALVNLYVETLLRIALLAHEGTLPFAPGMALEFQVLDRQLSGTSTTAPSITRP